MSNYRETFKQNAGNMETYDYEKALTEDVLEWIDENGGIKQIMIENGIHEKWDLAEWLDEHLFVSDVTGNANGSYWCSRYYANCALFNNLNLIADVIDNYGGDCREMIDDAERADVSIRCLLLYRGIENAMDKLEDEINAVIDEFEEIDLDEDETSEESEVM